MIIPQIKICCISSIEEAELAIKYGASAIGLVSEMPSGPGVISEDLIEEIASSVPRKINTFLLTSKTNADSIIEQHRKCKTTTLQIVDRVKINVLIKLRKELHPIRLVQVIHVKGEESITEAKNVEQFVDVLLLDSGNQKLKVKELGGTGRTHDWTISRKIRDAVSVPVYLAGGINANNVLDAAKEVEPFGIDLCSGVRKDGKLSEKLLREFFRMIENI
ncbi:MAG: phosphoribosylanthranilate isomerase [Bacteroidetes bacterium]|nr:phosphoribosylanthranilate isomerase [Bacteroidota bacterium]MCH8034004.1 phosphoribosylanthranilate isomerase [Bacteroidota bacterium]